MTEYDLPEAFDRIAAMARELHDTSQPESDLVDQVVQAAVREVPGAQYAGITLGHTNSGKVETQATTHDYPVMLYAIQQRHLEGPCLSATWEPEKYTDEYRDNLMRVIKGKLKGKTPRLKERETPHQAEVVDLMARLRASLEGTKKGKAGGEKTSSTTKKRKADGRKRRVA